MGSNLFAPGKIVRIERIEEVNINRESARPGKDPAGIVDPAFLAQPGDPFGHRPVIEHHRLHQHTGWRRFEDAQH